MQLLHDKFVTDSSAVSASGICHASSAKGGPRVCLPFCMTNEGEGKLCTLIDILQGVKVLGDQHQLQHILRLCIAKVTHQ